MLESTLALKLIGHQVEKGWAIVDAGWNYALNDDQQIDVWQCFYGG